MKRILFYVVVFFQVAVIAVLSWQYFLIAQYGKSIDLLLEKREYPLFEYGDYLGDTYVDYEINTIDSTVFPKEVAKDYNKRVYVLLEANKDGIYHVKKVSDYKLQADSNQVVFVGKYNYYDSISRMDKVTYGIEEITDQSLYMNLDKNKSTIVTVKVAPWGQKKVVAMKNVDN